MIYTHCARYVRVKEDDGTFEEGLVRLRIASPEPPTDEQYMRRIPRFVKAEYLGMVEEVEAA